MSGAISVFDTIQILQSPDDMCALINCATTIQEDDQLLSNDSIGFLLIAQESIFSDGTIDNKDFGFYAGDFSGLEVLSNNEFFIKIEDCQQMMQAIQKDEGRYHILKEVKATFQTKNKEGNNIRGDN